MRALDWKLPTGTAWEWFVATPGAIVLIIVIGLTLRWFFRRSIDRMVARTASGNAPGSLGARAGSLLIDMNPAAAARRHQRANTMGSLLKSVSTGVILSIIGVMVLSKVGIDIAPVIASAGIIGVALGFGAQNLVKDFLSGIFMILEDQYGVGDVIDAGEATGTVEAVSLRVTRLRDINGTVWYVRNGEIARIGNQSQNWARAVLDITVSYDSDLTHVQAVLLDEAHQLFVTDDFAGVILEEPEVWGVQDFGKDGAVVRVALKTAPLQQWFVARAMRQRIKARFDVEGITIPRTFVAGLGANE
jgi:small conductance mechanosensitive channel